MSILYEERKETGSVEMTEQSDTKVFTPILVNFNRVYLMSWSDTEFGKALYVWLNATDYDAFPDLPAGKAQDLYARYISWLHGQGMLPLIAGDEQIIQSLDKTGDGTLYTEVKHA
jgi:hypothetical protein